MSHVTPSDDPVLDIPATFREADELQQLQESADVEKLRSIMLEDEVVYRLVLCYHQESDGVLAATNKRIIFADKRFISSKVVTLLYRQVAAILYDEGLMTASLSIVTQDQLLFLEKIDITHAKRFVKFIEQAIGEDYRIEGDGHTFRLVSDVLQLDEIAAGNDEPPSNS